MLQQLQGIEKMKLHRDNESHNMQIISLARSFQGDKICKLRCGSGIEGRNSGARRKDIIINNDATRRDLTWLHIIKPRVSHSSNSSVVQSIQQSLISANSGHPVLGGWMSSVDLQFISQTTNSWSVRCLRFSIILSTTSFFICKSFLSAHLYRLCLLRLTLLLKIPVVVGAAQYQSPF